MKHTGGAKMKNSVDFLTFLLLPLAVTLDYVVIESMARTFFYIIGALSAVITLIYNVYAWIKRAKADEKITPDEVHELGEIINNGTTAINESLPPKEGKKDEKDD